jgi:hypothetical protein
MGVWDLMYLTQQHKKALALASNPNVSAQRQTEYADKAEVIRQHMVRYLERVEDIERLQRIGD